MKRTCKLAAAALLTAAVTVGTVTACAAAETAVTTETYAYLPDHSVYFYDVDDGYSWAFREVDTLAVAGVIQGRGDHLFYPRNAITRADFIVMLDRALRHEQRARERRCDGAAGLQRRPVRQILRKVRWRRRVRSAWRPARRTTAFCRSRP